jgi:hypothetical protein
MSCCFLVNSIGDTLAFQRPPSGAGTTPGLAGGGYFVLGLDVERRVVGVHELVERPDGLVVFEHLHALDGVAGQVVAGQVIAAFQQVLPVDVKLADGLALVANLPVAGYFNARHLLQHVRNHPVLLIGKGIDLVAERIALPRDGRALHHHFLERGGALAYGQGYRLAAISQAHELLGVAQGAGH